MIGCRRDSVLCLVAPGAATLAVSASLVPYRPLAQSRRKVRLSAATAQALDVRSRPRSLCFRLRSAAPSFSTFAQYCTHCCRAVRVQLLGRDANAIPPPRASRSAARATADAQDNALASREHAPPPAAPLPGFGAGRLFRSWRRPRDLLSSENAEEELWRTVTHSFMAARRPRSWVLSKSRPVL